MLLGLAMYISFALATAVLHHMHAVRASQGLCQCLSFSLLVRKCTAFLAGSCWLGGVYLGGSPGGLVALHVLYMAGWGCDCSL